MCGEKGFGGERKNEVYVLEGVNGPLGHTLNSVCDVYCTPHSTRFCRTTCN